MIFTFENNIIDKIRPKKNVFQASLKENKENALLEKEHSLQETLIGIKKKYGKNAILRGLDFEEGATAVERNQQIGGHKA